MRFWLLIAMSCVLSWRASAADCTYPKAPESIPDGKSAAEAEMVSAMTVFKQYNNEVTAYLSCLEGETADKIKEAGGSTSAIIQVKSMQSKKHNAAVTELQKLAGQFNEQVRSFKSRK
jgi:hypothetical protein